MQWLLWVREQYDVVVDLWFEMVEWLGILPLAPRWAAARERLVVLH